MNNGPAVKQKTRETELREALTRLSQTKLIELMIDVRKRIGLAVNLAGGENKRQACAEICQLIDNTKEQQ